ncbi:MAG: S41 family peptidase [Muribaculaceae bacterium]|nr:S41 family peptidase [Muribaculaceae bacterium]
MKVKNKLTYWTPIIGAICMIIGLWGGYYLLPHQPELTPSQKKLLSLLEMIDKEYVDSVSIDSLVEMSIPEILRNLDPHSAYIALKDKRQISEELEGSFGGVGVKFHILNDTIRLVEIVAGGPAEEVGLLAGDRIIAVDNENFTGKDIDEKMVFSHLRGEIGTTVTLTVLRPADGTVRNYTVTRGNIPQPSVSAAYMLTDSIGMVKVDKFARTTYDEFYKALTSLAFSGARKFVIDLRGNTGGYMEPAIMMVNEFLTPGRTIVETRGRTPGSNNIVLSDGTGLFRDFEVAVLLDEQSASASEIFAGAIQDNDRGLIIGRRSFGKGLVQKPLILPDSSEVRLTVQRYYTPSGRCIQKDYKNGNNSYELELFDRVDHGELFSADSIVTDKSRTFLTTTGRKMYGAGGIIPDVFVPTDTTGFNSYYLSIMRENLPGAYAYEYVDLNRSQLSRCKTLDQLLKLLPPDRIILESFADYAREHGIKKRPYYISQSGSLIVNQIKAVIAQDILGSKFFYEVYQQDDKAVQQAVKELETGKAHFPIMP